MLCDNMPQTQAQKAWVAANREKVREYNRVWKAKNNYLDKQKEYREKVNQAKVTLEESIITIDGIKYKQIITKGKDWQWTKHEKLPLTENQKYYIENKEKITKKKKEHDKEHREELSEKQRQYREKKRLERTEQRKKELYGC